MPWNGNMRLIWVIWNLTEKCILPELNPLSIYYSKNTICRYYGKAYGHHAGEQIGRPSDMLN